MFKTEKIAKKMWCVIQNIRCEASKCMAWRWHDEKYLFEKNVNAQKQADKMAIESNMGKFLPKHFFIKKTEKINSHRRGYCGLVGKPKLNNKGGM